METSAARNAGLPLVQRGKTPFIYTSFYEGRSCNPYLYVNAWVPEQQVPPIVDHFMKANNAKSFFLIGSDYAFGRGMLQFTRAYIEKQGGKVVGEEYLPMDGSDWTPILSKLRSSGADALVTSTAGGAPNVTLTKQLRAAGITLPYGNLAVDEGTAKSMGTDAEGIFISASYVTSIDTPANKKFLADMKEVRRSVKNTERSLGPRIRRGLRLQGRAGEGEIDQGRRRNQGSRRRLGRRSTRYHPNEQGTPCAFDDVSRPSPGGRKRKGYPSVQECGSGRPVPELEVSED